MSDPRTHRPDDPVTRAVVAARGLPIPDGPSATLVSQTLSVVRTAERTKSTLWERIRKMPRKSQAAALLGIAVSLLAAFVVLVTSSGASVALAQAVEKLVSAKTLKCDISVESTSASNFSAKGRMLFDDANNVRVEMHVHALTEEDDVVLVLNMNSGKSLVSIVGQKTAVVDLMKIGDENFLKETMIERLRTLAKQSYRELGRKQIDDVEAEGFEVATHPAERFWANAKTGDPVRIEIDDIPLPQPVGHANIIVNNFKIDGKLETSLFSAEPPEGYKVVKSPISIDLTGKPANDLEPILRYYAKESGGQFPERLMDFNNPIMKKLNTSGDSKEKATSESVELGLIQGGSVLRLRMYLESHKQGTDYQYYPGVSLGEKDRIVFWSRNTKTGVYTALFGDLRVEKVDKDKIPPPEKEAPK